MESEETTNHVGSHLCHLSVKLDELVQHHKQEVFNLSIESARLRGQIFGTTKKQEVGFRDAQDTGQVPPDPVLDEAEPLLKKPKSSLHRAGSPLKEVDEAVFDERSIKWHETTKSDKQVPVLRVESKTKPNADIDHMDLEANCIVLKELTDDSEGDNRQYQYIDEELKDDYSVQPEVLGRSDSGHDEVSVTSYPRNHGSFCSMYSIDNFEQAHSRATNFIVFTEEPDEEEGQRRSPQNGSSEIEHSGSMELLRHGHTNQRLKKYAVRSPWADHRDLEFVKLSEEYLALVPRPSQLHDTASAGVTDWFGVNMIKRQASEKHAPGRQSGAFKSARFSTAVTVDRKPIRDFSIDSLVVHPDSRIRMFWMMLSVLFLGYDCIMIPIDLCFEMESIQEMEFVTCIFWTTDIVVTFFTGVAIPGAVILEVKLLAVRYAKSWLILDLLIVSQDWLSLYVATASEADALSFVRGTRFARITRLIRLMRLLRIAKMKSFIRECVYRLRLANDNIDLARGWLLMTFILIILLHLTACLWHLLGVELDEGWVRENGLSDATVARRYFVSLNWACSRFHGMKSAFRMKTSFEIAIDTGLILLMLVSANIYAGQVFVVATSLNNSRYHHMLKLGHQYCRQNRIASSLDRRVNKALQASRLGGAGEIVGDEAKLLKEVPPTIKEDLLFEARMPFLHRRQVFADMFRANPRVVRHVCNEAMQTVLAVQSELVFATGDSCNRMLFVRSGAMEYDVSSSKRNTQEIANNQEQSNVLSAMKKVASLKPRSPSQAAPDPGWEKEQVRRGDSLSEAVLWTSWEHCGRLDTKSECILIALNAQKFGVVILEHSEACVHAVKYAKQYVRKLNRCEYGDISDTMEMDDLDVQFLDENVYMGTTEDHFMFISHYKVESGTEATLIRDLCDPILREDDANIANELISPIFIDSEDLIDLSRLKAHVRGSFNLVLLLTPGLLSRPWCLLEIVTAINSSVNIVPVEVQRPGCRYQYPTEEFYEILRNGQYLDYESVKLLGEEGISLQDVEAALRQVFKKISLPFSPHKSKSVRNAELQDIIKRCSEHAESTDHLTRTATREDSHLFC